MAAMSLHLVYSGATASHFIMLLWRCRWTPVIKWTGYTVNFLSQFVRETFKNELSGRTLSKLFRSTIKQ